MVTSIANLGQKKAPPPVGSKSGRIGGPIGVPPLGSPVPNEDPKAGPELIPGFEKSPGKSGEKTFGTPLNEAAPKEDESNVKA